MTDPLQSILPLHPDLQEPSPSAKLAMPADAMSSKDKYGRPWLDEVCNAAHFVESLNLHDPAGPRMVFTSVVDGVVCKAPLRQGPNNLAQATAPDGTVVTTQLSNLTLSLLLKKFDADAKLAAKDMAAPMQPTPMKGMKPQTPMKAKRAKTPNSPTKVKATSPMKAMKKASPMKAMKKASPMKVMKTTNPCGAKKGTFGDAKYSIMWYKKDTSVGIRQRFGEKKQIMSLGGRSTELCEDAMRKIGERVVAKLSSGSSVAECKTFGDDLVQRGYA